MKTKQETLPPQAAPAAPAGKIRILTEDEICRYAYELYERRNGRHGNDEQDWYQAINELTAYYEAQRYRVMLYWQARGV